MEKEKKKASVADYLANERTFLAWVRTAIGIMALGFVVVKFSLFLRQFSLMLDIRTAVSTPGGTPHYSSSIGIVLVILGICVMLMSYMRYRSTNKQLEEGMYQHSSLYITVLTAAVVLISALLVYYLIRG